MTDDAMREIRRLRARLAELERMTEEGSMDGRLRKGYSDTRGEESTRAERRRDSIASTFRADPAMEELDRRAQADPAVRDGLGASLRMRLDYYRGARSAHQAKEAARR